MKSARNVAKAGALFLALAIPAAPASADVGIGVAHEGDGNTVLLPIRLDSLTIEPEVSYFRSKNKNNTPTASGKETFTSYGLSTGIYTRRTLGPLFEGYLGGRVGITKFRDQADSGTTSFTQRSDSWFVGPTVGLQHFLSKQFSLSLDVGMVYQYSKNTFSFSGSDQSASSRNVDTRTRVLLRGYF